MSENHKAQVRFFETKTFRIGKRITLVRFDGGFWIRAFGAGISVKNLRKHVPGFSVRIGKRKMVRIGRWGITKIHHNIGTHEDSFLLTYGTVRFVDNRKQSGRER